MDELSLSYNKNTGQTEFFCKKGTVKRVKYKWGISMYIKGDSATIISISSSQSPSPQDEKSDGLLTQINELKIQNSKLQNDILKAVENTSRLQNENEQIGSKMKHLAAENAKLKEDITQLRNEKCQTRKMMDEVLDNQNKLKNDLTQKSKLIEDLQHEKKEMEMEIQRLKQEKKK
eukprot:234933_1